MMIPPALATSARQGMPETMDHFGGEVEDGAQRSDSWSENPVACDLSISGLSHSYGVRAALSNVSFSVERGPFCALLGPNGARKSTLYSRLTRLIVTYS